MGTVLGFNMAFGKYEKSWKSSSVSFISATCMHLNIGSKRSPDQCPKGLVQPILVVDYCKLKDNKLMFGQISIDKTRCWWQHYHCSQVLTVPENS